MTDENRLFDVQGADESDQVLRMRFQRIGPIRFFRKIVPPRIEHDDIIIAFKFGCEPGPVQTVIGYAMRQDHD